jgi:hypothetical protein
MGSSTANGEAREAWGSRDKAGDGLGAHWTTYALRAMPYLAPHLHGNSGNMRGLHAPKAWVHIPSPGAKKKNFFLREGGASSTCGDQGPSA